jgi:hypothetical protein
MQAIGSHFLRNAVHQALMRAIHRHYERDARSQGLSGQVQGAAISVAHRMSSDLKLNLHWHVLLADGVWTEQDGHATFHPAAPLDTMRVQETLHDAVLRIDKVLKRTGWQDRMDDPFRPAGTSGPPCPRPTGLRAWICPGTKGLPTKAI